MSHPFHQILGDTSHIDSRVINLALSLIGVILIIEAYFVKH